MLPGLSVLLVLPFCVVERLGLEQSAEHALLLRAVLHPEKP